MGWHYAWLDVSRGIVLKHLALISAIALAGCSVDNPTQHSYSTEQYDAGTGLTLLASSEMWISFDRIVTLQKDMQACTGLAIDPTVHKTVIAFRSFDEDSKDFYGVQLGAAWGIHFPRGGVSYIYINTDLDKAPYKYQGFGRDEYTDTQTVKHEFIHSILYHATGSGGHGEDFDMCDAWVNTYN